MAHVDAALVRQILDVPQRERKPDLGHDRRPDDLGAGLEVLQGASFRHVRTLTSALPASGKIPLTRRIRFLLAFEKCVHAATFDGFRVMGGVLAAKQTEKDHSGVPLIFREGGNIMIALDHRGNIIQPGVEKARGHDLELTVSCGKVSVGNSVIDKTIAAMLKACRAYDEGSPKPFPPPASSRRSDRKTIHVDMFLVPRELGEAIEGARFMLVLREVDDSPKSRKSQMRQTFGLTVTEADLADLLAQGMSLKDAAERLCISIWTARGHLRAIFQKTHTHRQGELIALLNHTKK